MKFIILLITIFSFNVIFSQNAYSIIYEADKQGLAISGNLAELLNYVQTGNPIRIGWVLKFKHPNNDTIIEMQHWADAGFITTLNGHVFAQISSIYQQGPGISDPPAVFLVNNKPDGWVSIIGTTGVMKQKYMRDPSIIKMMKESGLTDEQVTEELKQQETMNVHTKWAVMKIK